jgi:mono/diheme cytochrome c family protein
MLLRLILAMTLVSFCILADANAQPMSEPRRGELLYSTHCIACHNLQVHWSDKKLVKDWPSLRAEVRLWQKFSGLGWSEEDILEVARYLNTIHYHYPTPD